MVPFEIGLKPFFYKAPPVINAIRDIDPRNKLIGDPFPIGEYELQGMGHDRHAFMLHCRDRRAGIPAAYQGAVQV